jgi:glyoxylase-like metal-dependent hydrolase (beta-lactamase superfamily II)
LKISTALAAAALLGLIAADFALAQPQPGGPGAGPGGGRIGGPGGAPGGRRGGGPGGGPGGGRGGMPQGDPNVPVVERGGFGPSEAEIVQFRDDIWLIRSQASGNITVFTSDDGLLLVDSKNANEYTRVAELLKTVTDQPIRYLINTHFHGDHVGGNISMQSVGAAIIATANTRARLAQTQQQGLPVVTFDDRMEVHFGGKRLELYYFGRGHTDGDLVIHLPEERIVMTGDLFAGWGPSIRLIDYNGGGSLVEWPGTLTKAAALDFDVVIPGHSGVTDRTQLQAYIDENRRMLDLIRMLDEAGRTPQEITTAVQMEFGNMAFVVLPNVQVVLDELN